MTVDFAQAANNSSKAPGPSFIEVQFPISKLSKESYKERTAVAGQTLTSLGKWWGRKPLVLVRAIVLGVLLPATDDPAKDRDVFLKLMAMDDDGLCQRVRGTIPARITYEHCSPSEKAEYFDVEGSGPKWRTRLERAARESLQRRAFLRMSYDEKLKQCVRPEEIQGPSARAWEQINSQLGTQANSLNELVQVLGVRRFGRNPRVGDAFCGGGNIAFEAARLGCETFASDLNPVAALLTWGAFNVIGVGQAAVEPLIQAQADVFAAVRQQVNQWVIEENEFGWTADAYLYCNEVTDPSTGWKVPLAGSWIIAEKPLVVARLVPEAEGRRFRIEIIEDADHDDLARAQEDATWADGVRCPVDREGNRLPPSARQTTSFGYLRGRSGLRLWERDDILPRTDDVFQERLYAIRWVEKVVQPEGRVEVRRHYCAPTEADLGRERRVLELLGERLALWWREGFLPNQRIEPGLDNNRPKNARGWTFWHHLFNPRQLLLNGLFTERISAEQGLVGPALLLMLGRVVDNNSRLSRWKVGQGGGIGGGMQTFYSSGLITPMVNYSCRPMTTLETAFRVRVDAAPVSGGHTLLLADARSIDWLADVWITDPGYSDSINYAENSEFFLAWYRKLLARHFPTWYTDSKRALSVEKDEDFRQAMIDCYRNLADHMSDSGFQVVMFTHQDPEVWSDLALILWAAGLSVSAAWTIATETEAVGIKQGNYVQGTVVLVLRKRDGLRRGDFAEVFPEVTDEVKRQIQLMTDLEDNEDPNFSDSDFQLAAYAASLRVLTSYAHIEDVDLERELRRGKGEKSPLAEFIGRAVEIASNYLVPSGLDGDTWRKLGPEERFYLKGIDVEAKGEHRDGVYQEFARGLGVKEYRGLLASNAANEVRLRTPTEFSGRDLGGGGFNATLLRKVLFAIHSTARDAERDPRPARDYLHREVDGYWEKRRTILALLHFLVDRPKPEGGMAHWANDVVAARLLVAAIENDRS